MEISNEIKEKIEKFQKDGLCFSNEDFLIEKAAEGFVDISEQLIVLQKENNIKKIILGLESLKKDLLFFVKQHVIQSNSEHMALGKEIGDYFFANKGN